MLRQVDVLHFCGHARFNASERAKSSLVLANGEKLTTADLEGIAPLPRVMIFNACEAGRVRGVKTSGTNDTFSIAESILRSGVEAFLGTYWEVDDKAAAMFALDVYNGLTGQLSLRESVTEARRNLANANQREWANYILYGDGRFRLA
jgi:CHAT domain-containing protein